MLPWLALLVVLLAACAPTAERAVPPAALDFKPAELRQPALMLRVTFGPGNFSPSDRAALATSYEGTLLDGLNARALLARDVTRVQDGKLDAKAALARAREVGADHAVLVDVRVEQSAAVFCRDSRRAFRAAATVWSQSLEVLRASDGARRLAVDPEALAVTDIDADCDDPRASRRRTGDETVGEAVNRLLTRLLRS